MKTNGKYRILTLAAGIATACLIVFSQLFYFQAATYCQKKAQTEQEKNQPAKQAEQEKSHQAYISIPSNTISTVSVIEISDGIAFVIETLVDSETEETEIPAFQLTNRLLHTLFRFIIAPNAP